MVSTTSLNDIRQYLASIPEKSMLESILHRTLSSIRSLQNALLEEERRSHELHLEYRMLDDIIQKSLGDQRRAYTFQESARRVAATAEKVAQVAGSYAVPFVNAAFESLAQLTPSPASRNRRLPSHIMQMGRTTGRIRQGTRYGRPATRNTNKNAACPPLYNRNPQTMNTPCAPADKTVKENTATGAACSLDAPSLAPSSPAITPNEDGPVAAVSRQLTSMSLSTTADTSGEEVSRSCAHEASMTASVPIATTTSTTTLLESPPSPTSIASTATDDVAISPAATESLAIMDVSLIDVSNNETVHRLQVMATDTIQEAVDMWSSRMPLTDALKTRLIARLEYEEEHAVALPVTLTLRLTEI